MKWYTTIIALLIVGIVQAQPSPTPEQLVQQQLDTYEIETFLVPFSDSVAVYAFPDKLLYKGKAIM